MMKDISDQRWLLIKATLFVLMGLIAVTLILLEHPEWKVALYLGLAIWSFCRAYYFAFYVIQHYVDSSFRFSGLWAFVRYLLRKPR